MSIMKTYGVSIKTPSSEYLEIDGPRFCITLSTKTLVSISPGEIQ